MSLTQFFLFLLIGVHARDKFSGAGAIFYEVKSNKGPGTIIPHNDQLWNLPPDMTAAFSIWHDWNDLRSTYKQKSLGNIYHIRDNGNRLRVERQVKASQSFPLHKMPAILILALYEKNKDPDDQVGKGIKESVEWEQSKRQPSIHDLAGRIAEKLNEQKNNQNIDFKVTYMVAVRNELDIYKFEGGRFKSSNWALHKGAELGGSSTFLHMFKSNTWRIALGKGKQAQLSSLDGTHQIMVHAGTTSAITQTPFLAILGAPKNPTDKNGHWVAVQPQIGNLLKTYKTLGHPSPHHNQALKQAMAPLIQALGVNFKSFLVAIIRNRDDPECLHAIWKSLYEQPSATPQALPSQKTVPNVTSNEAVPDKSPIAEEIGKESKKASEEKS